MCVCVCGRVTERACAYLDLDTRTSDDTPQESFPSEAAEFNLWVEKQLSEKDVAKEHVMAELAAQIGANYHALIEGMKNVQVGGWVGGTCLCPIQPFPTR